MKCGLLDPSLVLNSSTVDHSSLSIYDRFPFSLACEYVFCFAGTGKGADLIFKVIPFTQHPVYTHAFFYPLQIADKSTCSD